MFKLKAHLCSTIVGPICRTIGTDRLPGTICHLDFFTIGIARIKIGLIFNECKGFLKIRPIPILAFVVF